MHRLRNDQTLIHRPVLRHGAGAPSQSWAKQMQNQAEGTSAPVAVHFVCICCSWALLSRAPGGWGRCTESLDRAWEWAPLGEQGAWNITLWDGLVLFLPPLSRPGLGLVEL